MELLDLELNSCQHNTGLNQGVADIHQQAERLNWARGELRNIRASVKPDAVMRLQDSQPEFKRLH